VDRRGHFQISLAIFMVCCVAYGVALVTDLRGHASRMLDRLREGGVTGRLYARMPVWVFRAFGAWAILFGVGQFFLIRYMPWRLDERRHGPTLRRKLVTYMVALPAPLPPRAQMGPG
jgi:hypothetical protein